jgi:hypothetical protein
MRILYFSQIDPLNCFLLSHSPFPPIFQQLSVGFLKPSSNRNTMDFDIIHPPLSLSLLHLIPRKQLQPCLHMCVCVCVCVCVYTAS